MNPIGIMQGRLSPAPAGRPQAFPWPTWEDEFAAAAACGFECLEWLVTDDGFDRNPICSDGGIERIRALMAMTGVRVASLCADFCIARPLVRVGPAQRQSTVERLLRLVDRIDAIDGEQLLIPVLEGGAIVDEGDEAVVLSALAPILARAAARGIRVGLESDLPADRQHALVERADSPALGVYYDVGNATASGFDTAVEVSLLGPVLTGVHIKDRRRFGASVPLGQGDAGFAAFFPALAATGYASPLILETPVGDDAVTMAGRNLAFVRSACR